MGCSDDAVAELEQSAGRAPGRGGVAAAEAFLERTVGLTADPARRAQRVLTAAQALDELGLARMDTLRARIADSPRAFVLLLDRVATKFTCRMHRRDRRACP